MLNTTQKVLLQSLLQSGNDIRIISAGIEDEQGIIEKYVGKRTLQGILARLRVERYNGERWARALVLSHYNQYGSVWVNCETGEYAN